VDECRDFKFGVRVGHSKFQPTDDKLSEKGMVMLCDPFLIFSPRKISRMV